MLIPERDKDGNPILRLGGVPIESKHRVRFIGTHAVTSSAGQTNQGDWQIPQATYQGSNAESVFVGVNFFLDGGQAGDRVTFQVVDVDNILGYGADYMVEEFGTSWYMLPGEMGMIREFTADLVVGLYLRVIYENTGALSGTVYLNTLRYLIEP